MNFTAHITYAEKIRLKCCSFLKPFHYRDIKDLVFSRAILSTVFLFSVFSLVYLQIPSPKGFYLLFVSVVAVFFTWYMAYISLIIFITREPYQDMNLRFAKFLEELSKTWPANDIASVKDLVSHSEYGEAMECLFALSKNGKLFTPSQSSTLLEMCNSLGMQLPAKTQ